MDELPKAILNRTYLEVPNPPWSLLKPSASDHVVLS